MRAREIAIDELGRLLPEGSSAGRLQLGAAWLDFAARALASIAGPGAHASAIAVFDAAGLAAAAPVIRTSPGHGTRPFPWDLEDLFFGLWVRAAAGGDRDLRARALGARAFGAGIGAMNPSLRRTLVMHAPLSPESGVWLAPRLSTDEARAGSRHGAAGEDAVSSLLAHARQIAAREDRCAVVPRVRRSDERWAGSFPGWIRAPSYSNAEIEPGARPDRHVRHKLKGNRQWMDRRGVTVTETRSAPPDVPFGALFAATSARHRDPAPRLDDQLFRDLGERFPEHVRFLVARAAGRAVGFVIAIENGASWEAWKCGADRALAAGAPVYLDLAYGRLREIAARAGAVTVEIGPGELPLKRRYGAAVVPMDCLLALPPGFRGARVFEAYARAVGKGIAERELDQVASTATTPK